MPERFISVCFFFFQLCVFMFLWSKGPCVAQSLCGGQRTTRCSSPPPLCLRWGLLFITVYARAGHGLLGTLMSLTPISIWVLGLYRWATISSFVGSRNPNSVLHACTAGCLPTEPSPLSLKQYILPSSQWKNIKPVFIHLFSGLRCN